MSAPDTGGRRLLQEEDPVFGNLNPLKTVQPMQLPTYKEVGQAIAYDRAKRGLKRKMGEKGKSGTNSESYEKVIDDLLLIHQEGNIPTKPRHKVKEKLLTCGRKSRKI